MMRRRLGIEMVLYKTFLLSSIFYMYYKSKGRIHRYHRYLTFLKGFADGPAKSHHSLVITDDESQSL